MVLVKNKYILKIKSAYCLERIYEQNDNAVNHNVCKQKHYFPYFKMYDLDAIKAIIENLYHSEAYLLSDELETKKNLIYRAI